MAARRYIISNLIPGNHKRLTLADHEYIEQALNQEKSFRDIAKYLYKDPSSISKEVWKHRIVNSWNSGGFNTSYKFCIYRYCCKKTNACDKPQYMYSIHTKYDYNAKATQRKCEELSSISHSGVNLTQKELQELDRIVRPLIEQGQSPYMIP